ncbi:MAG: hypothetical protein JWO80_1002 [Bryobacterales bacterium]|nr:hypothetical protein [Bryobacterales bacterium]
MFFFENYFGRRHQRNRQIAQTLGSLKRAVRRHRPSGDEIGSKVRRKGGALVLQEQATTPLALW